MLCGVRVVSGRADQTPASHCTLVYPFGYDTAMNPIEAVRAVSGLTQADLAEAAGTSQPTIATYESGAKSPTWRTVERVAAAVGLACYPCVGAGLTRDQARSLALHRAIAVELRADSDAVLATARANIAKMRSVNAHAAVLLDEWEQILYATVDQVVARMIDPSEHGRDLRQVTPFAGVLKPAQRAAVYSSFRNAA